MRKKENNYIRASALQKWKVLMRNTNTKICFLLLAAGALCCAGCETTQQARFNDMVQARQLASALNYLSPQQRDAAAIEIYSSMQAQQAEDNRVRAQILAEGFQNAGRIISESSRPVYPGSAFTIHNGNSSYTTFGY
jgi:hypothetical protein